MSSTNKTEYLMLNQWLGSDRPQRIDFVDDNRIIDDAIKIHFSDTSKHLSNEQREKLNQPYVMVSYSGSGESSKVIDLGIQPNFVIVFMKDAPPTEDDGSGNILLNQCFTAKSNGTSGGALINGNNLTVYYSQTPENGIRYNLNKTNGQYCIVAFK